MKLKEKFKKYGKNGNYGIDNVNAAKLWYNSEGNS